MSAVAPILVLKNRTVKSGEEFQLFPPETVAIEGDETFLKSYRATINVYGYNDDDTITLPDPEKCKSYKTAPATWRLTYKDGHAVTDTIQEIMYTAKGPGSRQLTCQMSRYDVFQYLDADYTFADSDTITKICSYGISSASLCSDGEFVGIYSNDSPTIGFRNVMKTSIWPYQITVTTGIESTRNGLYIFGYNVNEKDANYIFMYNYETLSFTEVTNVEKKNKYVSSCSYGGGLYAIMKDGPTSYVEKITGGVVDSRDILYAHSDVKFEDPLLIQYVNDKKTFVSGRHDNQVIIKDIKSDGYGRIDHAAYLIQMAGSSGDAWILYTDTSGDQVIRKWVTSSVHKFSVMDVPGGIVSNKVQMTGMTYNRITNQLCIVGYSTSFEALLAFREISNGEWDSILGDLYKYNRPNAVTYLSYDALGNLWVAVKGEKIGFFQNHHENNDMCTIIVDEDATMNAAGATESPKSGGVSISDGWLAGVIVSWVILVAIIIWLSVVKGK